MPVGVVQATKGLKRRSPQSGRKGEFLLCSWTGTCTLPCTWTSVLPALRPLHQDLDPSPLTHPLWVPRPSGLNCNHGTSFPEPPACRWQMVRLLSLTGQANPSHGPSCVSICVLLHLFLPWPRQYSSTIKNKKDLGLQTSMTTAAHTNTFLEWFWANKRCWVPCLGRCRTGERTVDEGRDGGVESQEESEETWGADV